MKMKNLNEMLDNIVQRIDDEGEAQGVQFSYMVWVVDATDGRGDLRNNGDIDALLAMSVMAQHKLCHELEGQGCIKKVVSVIPDEPSADVDVIWVCPNCGDELGVWTDTKKAPLCHDCDAIAVLDEREVPEELE